MDFCEVCTTHIETLNLYQMDNHPRFPNNVFIVSCMESIAAPSLALDVVIPFCRIVQHTCGFIHVNDGIAGTIVLSLGTPDH